MDNDEISKNFFYNLPDPTFFVANYGRANGRVNFRTSTSDNATPVNPVEPSLLYERIFEFAKMVEGRKSKRAVDLPRKIARKWTIKEKGKLA